MSEDSYVLRYSSLPGTLCLGVSARGQGLTARFDPVLDIVRIIGWGGGDIGQG